MIVTRYYTNLNDILTPPDSYWTLFLYKNESTNVFSLFAKLPDGTIKKISDLSSFYLMDLPNTVQFVLNSLSESSGINIPNGSFVLTLDNSRIYYYDNGLFYEVKPPQIGYTVDYISDLYQETYVYDYKREEIESILLSGRFILESIPYYEGIYFLTGVETSSGLNLDVVKYDLLDDEFASDPIVQGGYYNSIYKILNDIFFIYDTQSMVLYTLNKDSDGFDSTSLNIGDVVDYIYANDLDLYLFFTNNYYTYSYNFQTVRLIRSYITNPEPDSVLVKVLSKTQYLYKKGGVFYFKNDEESIRIPFIVSEIKLHNLVGSYYLVYSDNYNYYGILNLGNNTFSVYEGVIQGVCGDYIIKDNFVQKFSTVTNKFFRLFYLYSGNLKSLSYKEGVWYSVVIDDDNKAIKLVYKSTPKFYKL